MHLLRPRSPNTSSGSLNPRRCLPSLVLKKGSEILRSRNPSTAPLVMWLSGGPGCSSQLALFAENGPCKVAKNGQYTYRNPASWHYAANVMWVDQPAGVGFSTGLGTHDEKGVANNMLVSLERKVFQCLSYIYIYIVNNQIILCDTNIYIYLYLFACFFAKELRAVFSCLRGSCRSSSKLSRSTKTPSSTSSGNPMQDTTCRRSATESGAPTRPLIERCEAESQAGQGQKIPLAGIAIGNGLTDPLEQYKCLAFS